MLYVLLWLARIYSSKHRRSQSARRRTSCRPVNIAASIKVMDDSSPYCLNSIKKLLLTLLRPRDPLRERSSPTKVPTIAQHEPRGKRDAGIGAYGPLLPFDRRGTSTCPLPSRERVEFPCHTSPCCTLSSQSLSRAMPWLLGDQLRPELSYTDLSARKLAASRMSSHPFL